MEAESWLGRPKDGQGSAGSFSHFRPLSSYSRKILCESAGGWRGLSQDLAAPFCNMKVEIVNTDAPLAGKRRLDDPSPRGGCDMPPRKRLARCSSTAEGDVPLDARRGFPEKKSPAPKSPAESQNPLRLTMIRKAAGRATLQSPAPRQQGEAATGGVVTGEAGSGGGAQNPLPCPERSDRTALPDELDADHAFDFDIDGMLSSSPVPSAGSEDGEDIEAFIERCHSYYEKSRAHTPDGHAQGAESGEDSRKEAASLDEGYFSRSYREALRGGSGGASPCPEVSPLQCTLQALGAELPPSNRELDATVGDGALLSPAPPEGPAVCRNLMSVLDDPPRPETPEALQGAEGVGPEAGFGVGAPESSVHRGSLSGGLGGLGGRGVAVEVTVAKNCPSPCKEKSGFLCNVGAPPKKLFRDTAQPTVQVRSVVVVPQKRQGPDNAKVGLRHMKRPVVYDCEADWQREKEQYVAAVSSHMANSAPRGGGVMAELVNLMKTVARQGTTNGNQPWQHPSDLTRRNYGGPHGRPRISLQEWQERSGRSFCRFAGVPARFPRSPVP